jgi:DNA-binding helix-hairpin-helix protein with protein kinase domain
MSLASELGPGALLAGDSREYRLGQVIAEGGEGIVYRVQGRDDVVAKLYKEWDYSRDAKLHGLIDLSTKRLRRVAAWPLSRLCDAEDRTVGFVMESLEGWQPLHAAYQIRSRLQHSPHRSWAFLVRIARNLATCVHHAHDAGLVIGDLNESNILVGPDAMVKIIDADSFQMRLGDKLFPCKVGKPELLAPELQGHSLEGVERTPDQDRFALAVLVFQTLVFGRHPFAGRPTKDEDLPLEESIRRGWYIFSQRRDVPVAPPPHLTLDWLPPEILDLFERAFDPAEPVRPSAREWYGALKELEAGLGACNLNGSHVHWTGHKRCPWCALEERWNVTLFRPAPLDPLSAADFDVEEVWKRIVSLPFPKAEDPPAPVDYKLLAPAELPGWQKWVVRPILTRGVNSGFWIIYLAIVFGKEVMRAGLILQVLIMTIVAVAAVQCFFVERVRRRVRRANERLEHLWKEWNAKADAHVYEMRLSDLNTLRHGLLNNQKRYEAARQERIKQLHQEDLDRYLRKYSILAADSAQGRSKLSQLHDRGIETAADILPDNLRRVRDFESQLWDDLLMWRRALEEQFWNASSYSLPPHEERTILEKIHREDVSMRRELLAARDELSDLAMRLRDRQEELRVQAEPYRQVIHEHGPTLVAFEPAPK